MVDLNIWIRGRCGFWMSTPHLTEFVHICVKILNPLFHKFARHLSHTNNKNYKSKNSFVFILRRTIIDKLRKSRTTWNVFAQKLWKRESNKRVNKNSISYPSSYEICFFVLFLSAIFERKWVNLGILKDTCTHILWEVNINVSIIQRVWEIKAKVGWIIKSIFK